MPRSSRSPGLLRPLLSGGYAALDRFWPDPGLRTMTVRFAGRRALLVRGEDGARLFYNALVMRRRHAVPAVVASPLFGRGAVHGLDDDDHDHRKALFLACLDESGVADLVEQVDQTWRARIAGWSTDGPVSVFDEAVQALATAVIRWAGVEPPPGPRAPTDLATMVDGFGAADPASAVRRRLARRRCESWAVQAVRTSREAQRPVEQWTVVDRVARATDLSGATLNERVAAVELLNILRPTVAVAWFVAFAAVAIADDPTLRPALCTATGTARQREAFAHELRRAYPFVPLLAAKTRTATTWRGHRLRAGQRVLLDVWGTNHLADRWLQPETFRPSRFEEQPPNAFDFVPQGGGEPVHGHRCPGEPATVAIIEACSQALADLDFRIDPLDRAFPLTVMPTRPPSGPRLRA